MNIRVEIGNFLRGKGPIGILRFSQRLLLELFTSRTTITPPILDPVNFHTDFSLLFELYDFDWKISVVLFIKIILLYNILGYKYSRIMLSYSQKQKRL